MLSNRELTQREFSTSNYVKIAIHCLMEENYPGTKEYLLAALEVIHREQRAGRFFYFVKPLRCALSHTNIASIFLTNRIIYDRLTLSTTKGKKMPTFEFSEGFDAVGFFMDKMERDEDFDYYHSQWDE